MAGPRLRLDRLQVPGGQVGRGNPSLGDLPEFVAPACLYALANQYNYISQSHRRGRGGRATPLGLLFQRGFRQVGTPGSLVGFLVRDLGDMGLVIRDAADQEGLVQGVHPATAQQLERAGAPAYPAQRIRGRQSGSPAWRACSGFRRSKSAEFAVSSAWKSRSPDSNSEPWIVVFRIEGKPRVLIPRGRVAAEVQTHSAFLALAGALTAIAEAREGTRPGPVHPKSPLRPHEGGPPLAESLPT